MKYIRIAIVAATVCSAGLFVSTAPTAAQTVLSAEGSSALASGEGRLRIGRGKDYVPSNVPAHVLFDQLKGSMKARRDFAWSVVEKMLEPQRITLLDDVSEVEVPLWQTWYEGRPSAASGNRELDQVFLKYFELLKAALDIDPRADLKPIVDATIAEFATKDLSSSLTDDNLSSTLHQHSSSEAGDLIGQGTTMFSPSFIEHAMLEARGIHECTLDSATASSAPPSTNQFSPCILEFPRSAVMIKTAWIPLGAGAQDHATDAAAITTVINDGTWPRVPRIPVDRSEIYTNVSSDGTEFALNGIHFVTKDVREWVWITLWWDPDANEDFGADRPDSIANFNNGVWKNYKMCVNSSFEEGDPMPWSDYTGDQASLGASLKATVDAIQAHLNDGADVAVGQPADGALLPAALGPWTGSANNQTSWCSNPNIETHAANGRTNCIGCHQIAFTQNEARSQLAGVPIPASFRHAMYGDYPQFGRARVRNNFPAEFSWSFGFEFRPAIANAMTENGFAYKWSER